MALPQPGARLRRGHYVTVLRLDPPNAAGNVRCIVEDDHGRLGWIMYYADGTASNLNMFREDQAGAVRASLDSDAGE